MGTSQIESQICQNVIIPNEFMKSETDVQILLCAKTTCPPEPPTLGSWNVLHGPHLFL